MPGEVAIFSAASARCGASPDPMATPASNLNRGSEDLSIASLSRVRNATSPSCTATCKATPRNSRIECARSTVEIGCRGRDEPLPQLRIARLERHRAPAATGAGPAWRDFAGVRPCRDVAVPAQCQPRTVDRPHQAAIPEPLVRAQHGVGNALQPQPELDGGEALRVAAQCPCAGNDAVEVDCTGNKTRPQVIGDGHRLASRHAGARAQ